MSKVQVYSVGLIHCSVCAPADMTPQEVEAEVNLKHPSGTTNGWIISKDTHFAGGQTNPTTCENDPDRKHYLMDC